jgi:hypothetical protein
LKSLLNTTNPQHQQSQTKTTHLPEVLEFEPPGFYGTPLFAACAALRGALPCPRDDCEGLLYSLLSMAAPRGGNGRRPRNTLPFEVRARVGALGFGGWLSLSIMQPGDSYLPTCAHES